MPHLKRLFEICREIDPIQPLTCETFSLQSCKKEVPDESRSRRRMIWPVTVVPTLAPMTIPSD